MLTLLTVGDLIEVLEVVRNIIITQHLSIFCKVASMLAAILAAWAFIKISHDYMEGQGVTFWMFAKPLVMVILVCNFNTFVLTPVHHLTNIFTTDLTLRTNQAQNSWAKSMATLLRNVQNEGLNPIKTQMIDEVEGQEAESIQETGYLKKEKNSGLWFKIKKRIGAVFAAITNIAMSVTNIIHMSGATILYTMLRVATHVIYYVQICVCYVLLTLYGLVGPFVFAFSILGDYSKGVSNWLARYIHTAFWIPVGQMVFLIGSVIMENVNKVTNCNIGDIPVASTNGLFSNFNIGCYMGIIMIAATAMCILNVPKICTYIIESAGSGGVAGSMGQQTKGAASMAAKVLTKI